LDFGMRNGENEMAACSEHLPIDSLQIGLQTAHGRLIHSHFVLVVGDRLIGLASLVQ